MLSSLKNRKSIRKYNNQKVTDKFVKEIDTVIAAKEKEVMSV